MNVRTMGTLPGYVKGIYKMYKDQFEELQKIFSSLMNNQAKYAEKGKQCFEKKTHLPPQCYELAKGPIEYTSKKRHKWE